MINERLRENHNHPLSAYFCCSMWPWCNPLDPAPPGLPKLFRVAWRKRKWPKTAGTGLGGWADQFPLGARWWLGHPVWGILHCPPNGHQTLIHSQNIRRHRTKYFTFQCPTFHQPSSVRFNIGSGHQIIVNVTSQLNSLTSLTPLRIWHADKAYPNQSWVFSEYLVFKSAPGPYPFQGAGVQYSSVSWLL